MNSCISLFFITIMKYLNLCNFIKKDLFTPSLLPASIPTWPTWQDGATIAICNAFPLHLLNSITNK
jgi:hypothetical protein